jgi:hypothetical protein
MGRFAVFDGSGSKPSLKKQLKFLRPAVDGGYFTIIHTCKPAWLDAVPAPRRRSFLASWLFKRKTSMSKPAININTYGKDAPAGATFGKGARSKNSRTLAIACLRSNLRQLAARCATIETASYAWTTLPDNTSPKNQLTRLR